MSDIAIKADGVTKQYRLGTIGGGTLRGDLQSVMAKLRGREDPNSKIGSTAYTGNEKFLALDDVSFEVKKGEALGIIGHNGAGKSTLLKILSRVTAPTKGQIEINGRIASMLEVGTGFHPELTGRENVYLNGAILGMSKAEIRQKFDDIVEFAEMEQFIDTPVKRYSSGMYVKLAFSVAAHLDSEILVMDEVLAVGDMKFQQKCLGRMGDAAGKEGRTVLYVSHNMNTIRQLCTRCMVLDHGSKRFDGDVEDGIGIYLEGNNFSLATEFDLSKMRMPHLSTLIKAKMVLLSIHNVVSPIYTSGEYINFSITIESYQNIKNLLFRFEIRYIDDSSIGVAQCPALGTIHEKEKRRYSFSFSTNGLVRGQYKVCGVLFEMNEFGTYDDLDAVWPLMIFEIIDENQIKWNIYQWGHIQFPDLKIIDKVVVEGNKREYLNDT